LAPHQQRRKRPLEQSMRIAKVKIAAPRHEKRINFRLGGGKSKLQSNAQSDGNVVSASKRLPEFRADSLTDS
jgi:hypothetical protein